MKKNDTQKQPDITLPVQQAILYINEHFTEKITLVELAKILAFSPNHLGYLFKLQMGITFTEYLNNIRMNYACSLLQSSDLLVKEIAFISGFHSAAYFTQSFKQKVHLTPKEYRKVFH